MFYKPIVLFLGLEKISLLPEPTGYISYTLCKLQTCCVGIYKKSCRQYPRFSKKMGLENKKFSLDPYSQYQSLFFHIIRINMQFCGSHSQLFLYRPNHITQHKLYPTSPQAYSSCTPYSLSYISFHTWLFFFIIISIFIAFFFPASGYIGAST